VKWKLWCAIDYSGYGSHFGGLPSTTDLKSGQAGSGHRSADSSEPAGDYNFCHVLTLQSLFFYTFEAKV
jgi:hypothetical protein